MQMKKNISLYLLPMAIALTAVSCASGRRSARRRLRRADLSLPEALRHSGAPLSDGAVAAHPEAVALRSGSRKPRSRKRTVKKRPATRRRTTEAKNTNGGRKVGPRTRNGREILSRPLSSCRLCPNPWCNPSPAKFPSPRSTLFASTAMAPLLWRAVGWRIKIFRS